MASAQPMTAFWGMVINNYDETDLALVEQGYPDYIRKITYTKERGEKGTPHIQAYVRLFRQQRLSYMKKLFPRGNFKALTSDEYRLNAEKYAQKQDATAEGPSVIQNNPFPDPVVELTDVLREVYMEYMDRKGGEHFYNVKGEDVLAYIAQEERSRVARKPALAKFYVSSTYKAVKTQFWRSVLQFVENEHTHTHTHTDEKFSQSIDIPTYDGGNDTEGGSSRGDHEGDTEDEDYEDDCSQASEGSDEGGSSFSGSSYASEEHGE